MIIGILNETIYTSFTQSNTVGGVIAVDLTISELKVTKFKQYRVEVSRYNHMRDLSVSHVHNFHRLYSDVGNEYAPMPIVYYAYLPTINDL